MAQRVQIGIIHQQRLGDIMFGTVTKDWRIYSLCGNTIDDTIVF